MALGRSKGPILIGKTCSIGDAEGVLADWSAKLDWPRLEPHAVRLASDISSDLLADVWAAIAVGTICTRSSHGAKVITWGHRSWPDEDLLASKFAHTFAGLVALQLAESVVTEKPEKPVPTVAIERAISVAEKGVLSLHGGGHSKALVEFDPQQPLSMSLQGQAGDARNPSIRRLMFEQTLLRFRSDLEIGGMTRGIPVQNAGRIQGLTTFLGELYDNAFEHGRQLEKTGVHTRGLRVLRMRKHLSNSKAELLSRGLGVPRLAEYIETIPYGEGSQCLIEASVSDFGLGIVDHLLSSPQGQLYKDFSRRAVLERIITERISAKGADPAAGQGIGRALQAAKNMSSFVSLRTGEFWLTQSFADNSAELKLADTSSAPLTRIAGTHWQFFWPQPL